MSLVEQVDGATSSAELTYWETFIVKLAVRGMPFIEQEGRMMTLSVELARFKAEGATWLALD